MPRITLEQAIEARHRIIPGRPIRWRPGQGRSGALCARGGMLLCRANHARLKSSADSLGRKAARDFRSRKKYITVFT